jgi:hypothetical protein
MIFEMTQDYAVIVPLMISNLVSLFISSRLQQQPIYEALAIQDGIHLPSLLNSRELKICLLQSSTIEFSVIRGFSQAFRPCRDSRSALGAGEKPYLGKALPKLTDTETSSETAGTG